MRAMTLRTTPITVPAMAPLLRGCEDGEEPDWAELEALEPDVADEDEFAIHDVFPESNMEKVADRASIPNVPPVSVATSE